MTSTDTRVVAPDVIDLRDGRRPSATPAPPDRLRYLPALDGLRAVAVLGVLLYHADVSWMPGGFLGVDVFFVLSGYLITTLLLEASARMGRPDLKRFYIRRARRLLPAMLAVLIGSTVLVLTIAPDEAGNQQRDLPAALTYVTNWVYVFTDQSYFEATGRPPMLQHLWSLAVEEQFYLIWPWVFIFAWRLGGTARVRRFAGIGALVSTMWMALLSVMHGYPTAADPSRAYFGTDAHAMGILTGAALATLWIPRLARTDILPGARRVVDASGVLTLLLVLVVFWQTSFDSWLLYRGGFLALSVLVAALIVAVTHPASRVGLLLGTAPLRYLGTRSYGIYLWHWPIFLVTRPGLDVPLTGFANLMLRLGLTIGVAELSYRYLEDPVRRLGFAGSWHALADRLAVGPWILPTLARRPLILVTALGVILLAMTLRLYALPSSADSLHGVTSMSADQGPPDAAAAPEQPAAPVTQPGYLGLGESVMLGASGALTQTFPGIAIDAAVGSQETDIQARVKALSAQGQLPSQVILHTGTNGPIAAKSLRTILATLQEAEVTQVVVVNNSVPRRYQDPNNSIFVSVVPEFANAILVDWHAAVLADPSLVNADGVHPSGVGVVAYANLIKQGFADLAASQQTS